MSEKLLKKIQIAIDKNEDCRSASLFITPKAFMVENGFFESKDKEVLALLSGCYFGYWFYAHIFKIENDWVSAIAWVNVFIQAQNKNELFRRYSRAIDNGMYEPSFAQTDTDVLVISNTFEEACGALVNMINKFKLEKRIGRSLHGDDDEKNEPEGFTDYRILDVYGFPSCSSS